MCITDCSVCAPSYRLPKSPRDGSVTHPLGSTWKFTESKVKLGIHADWFACLTIFLKAGEESLRYPTERCDFSIPRSELSSVTCARRYSIGGHMYVMRDMTVLFLAYLFPTSVRLCFSYEDESAKNVAWTSTNLGPALRCPKDVWLWFIPCSRTLGFKWSMNPSPGGVWFRKQIWWTRRLLYFSMKCTIITDFGPLVRKLCIFSVRFTSFP